MAKTKNVFIYFEEKISDSWTNNGLADSGYDVPVKLRDMKPDAIIELYNSKISEDKLMEIAKASAINGEEAEILKVELACIKKKSKYAKGIYYAHEYSDDPECDGKGRLITYTNDFKEYEVKCLDKDRYVLDGIWEYEEHSTPNNGCGDEFEPMEF